MGAYGSPQLGICAEQNKDNKQKKLSNPILIIIDAIVLLFACLLIESLTLLEYGDLLSIVFLLTFGLITHWMALFLRKIFSFLATKIKNWGKKMFLFFSKKVQKTFKISNFWKKQKK